MKGAYEKLKTIENLNYKIKKIETGVQEKPNIAQFILKNDRQKDITIFSISLLPDKQFKDNGNIFIDVFGTTNNTLADIRAGDLDGVTSVEIKVGDEGFNFRRNDSLRFFVWRDGSGADVQITLDVITGEKLLFQGFQKGDRR